MSLYRTYRPQTFLQLIGQTGPVTFLLQSIRKGKIGHAYLFSGPRGTGKTSAARIFARAACCLHPQNGEPCNTCAHCLAILENRAPDFLEIDAASNRGIEDVRSLRESAQYPPSLLPYRIFLIDEAHMLTGDAFNALLKTLEEPPPHCIFILATTELHKLPITVRSRCQLVQFQRGSVAAITEKLQSIVSQAKLQIELDALTLIAESADGGFRDAETLLEQLTTEHTSLSANQVAKALGTLPATICQALLDACLAQDEPEVRSLLAQHFQDDSKRYTWILTDLINRLRSAAKPGPLHTYFLEQLLEAYILQKSSPIASLPLEIACLKTVAHKHGSQPVAAISQRVSTTLPDVKNTSIDKAKIIISAPEPAQTVPVVELRELPPEKLSDIRKAWRRVADDIATDHLPLSQMLKQSIIHVADGTVLLIHVKYKFHVDKLMEKKNVALVQDLLYRYTETKWTVQYELNASIPRQDPKRQLAEGDELSASSVTAVFTAA